MKKLSIGMRLALWYFAIFAVAQVMFGAGMWLILRHDLYDIVDDSLEDQIEDLRNFLAAQKKDASVATLQQEVAGTYTLEHSGKYLELYDDNNALLYRSKFLEQHPVNFPSAQRADSVDIRLAGRHFRFMQQTIEANGRAFTATTGIPIHDVVKTLSVFRSYLLMVAPMLFLVAAAGGYWLSRHALAPVDALVRTAADISGANLNRRLPKLETGDELQRLSDTLNAMLARIEAAFQRVTEFTADASHELRTPVALIRTEAELALRRSRGETEYRDSLRHVLLEAERTTNLIEQLLSLARADSGREALDMQPVDLRDTVRCATESWQQVASIRNLDFSASIDGDHPFVLGDETVLRRLVNILLDNAFKYTPTPGSVTLSLEHDGEHALITVQDSGVGIAEDEQEKIFERFYRVDKARSRAQGGAGLGLAIARWIVTQHSGSITVKSMPGGGSTFCVQLPAIAAPVRNPQPV